MSSDDEDEPRDNDVYVTDKVSRELGPLEDETASSKYVHLMNYQTLNFAFLIHIGPSYIAISWLFFEVLTYSSQFPLSMSTSSHFM